eukprot:PhM_4_TR14132/c0_g1_i1/m.34071
METSVKAFMRIRPYKSREIEEDSAQHLSASFSTTLRSPNARSISPSSYQYRSPVDPLLDTFSSTMVNDDQGLKCEYRVTPTSIAIQKKVYEFDEVWWSVPEDQLEAPEGMTVASQEHVYRRLCSDIVPSMANGYNCCIFAYGQTGSGKTHTMIGDTGDADNAGLIPRLCSELLALPGYTCRIMFVELYNDKVFDLLTRSPKNRSFGCDDPSPRRMSLAVPPSGAEMLSPVANNRRSNAHEGLRVRTHPVEGPYVEGVRWVDVETVDDVLAAIEAGLLSRTVTETKMNERSSRSHAILRLALTHSTSFHSSGKTLCSLRRSNINLVDLAGSERVKQSGVTGSQFTEATFTNQSLSTLRKVIDALVEDPSRKHVIPYRESNLTYILSPSLGGNCKTFVIGTMSPATQYIIESINTLTYASKARCIKAVVQTNEDDTGRLISRLKQELERATSAHVEAKNQEERAELESQIAALNLSVTEMDNKERDAQRQIKEAEARLAKTEGVLEQTHANLKMKTVELLTAEEKLKFHRRQNVVTKWQVAMLNAYISTQRKKHAEEVEKLYTSHRTELRDQKKRAERLEDELAMEHDKLLRQQVLWEEQRKQFASKVLNLEEEVRVMTNKCVEQTDKVGVSRRHAEDLEGVVHELRSHLSDARAKIAVMEQHAKHDHDSAIDNLTCRLEEALTERNALRRQLEALQAEHTATMNDELTKRAELFDHIHELQQQLQTVSEDHEAKASDAAGYEARLTHAYGALTDLVGIVGPPLGVPPPQTFEAHDEVSTFLGDMRRAVHVQLMEDTVGKVGESTVVTDYDLSRFGKELRSIPDEDTQRTLLHRFRAAIEGHKAKTQAGYRFGSYTGLPDRNEDPLVLINMIANLTHENEMLVEQVAAKGEEVGETYLKPAPRIGVHITQQKHPRRAITHPRTGQVVPLQEGVLCVFGREAFHDITVEDKRVSRTHAVVKSTAFPDPCVIFDLGSQSGTYVNQKPVDGKGHQLTTGDVVTLWVGDDADRFSFVFVENTASIRRNSPHRVQKSASGLEGVLDTVTPTRARRPSTPQRGGVRNNSPMSARSAVGTQRGTSVSSRTISPIRGMSPSPIRPTPGDLSAMSIPVTVTPSRRPYPLPSAPQSQAASAVSPTPMESPRGPSAAGSSSMARTPSQRSLSSRVVMSSQHASTTPRNGPSPSSTNTTTMRPTTATNRAMNYSAASSFAASLRK